ncbi:MAG: hypothetical protein K5778_09510 [Bacteroidaceae bacterium]|nr:hypothetical protein [Bacteroidaceae bacterium]
MKIKNVFKGLFFLILLVGVVGYIAYVVMNMTDGDPKEVCTEVSLVVEENPNASFIDDKKVEALLKEAQLYPKGKPMNTINTNTIEETLRQNNFIAEVECYKTNNGMAVGKGKVCIRVTQRTPVVFVLPDGKNGYYIDADGMVLANNGYAKNIVTATGNITQEFASEHLAAFGRYLLNHPFWDNMIEQIHVEQNAKGQHLLTLVPRIGDHTIFLGEPDRLEAKLRRLQIFYEQGLPQVGWNKYSRLDLEYDNQIVCTKK